LGVRLNGSRVSVLHLFVDAPRVIPELESPVANTSPSSPAVHDIEYCIYAGCLRLIASITSTSRLSYTSSAPSRIASLRFVCVPHHSLRRGDAES
jgi:hypothetical protein